MLAASLANGVFADGADFSGKQFDRGAAGCRVATYDIQTVGRSDKQAIAVVLKEAIDRLA